MGGIPFFNPPVGGGYTIDQITLGMSAVNIIHSGIFHIEHFWVFYTFIPCDEYNISFWLRTYAVPRSIETGLIAVSHELYILIFL